MAFGDVKTPKGLQELNNFLAEHSYIEGYVPSKADLSVFEALGKAPAGDNVHAQRWYRHIASFSVQERAAWGGQALPQVAGSKPTVAEPAPASAANDDDDVDLFGSEDEEESAEAAKLKEERLAAYNAKKSKKPVLIAKSSIILDVKPWDDETDMEQMETSVRSIEMDGLLWGAAKLVPVGYGINKLQICCVIEDDKVSVDELQEKIQDFEDFVQSVDIAAFNKI
ncbi:probable elongation factor 1-beta [Topomyia yanbarensis]|uniref:probable elongation factor 1-beta n=1 Tax=Topomyia yanbarensis TaxID=2498891 RepID=UPI00273C4D22|nr:probable elongation factor 1-beta [Topomyia yanbarensis]